MDPIAINAARRKLIIWVSLAIFAVVLFVLLSPKLMNQLGRTSGNTIYAVFLNNDQVYFGTIADQNNRSLTLKNVYYLAPQALRDGGTAATNDAALLKLGNELHAPEDWLQINQDHVLFLEKLREDGKIAQAIRAYQK